VALNAPALIVAFTPALQGRIEFAEVVAVMDPQQLLVQWAHEPLGDAVALGRAHKAGTRLDAKERDLGLEVVADVLRAVIMAQPQGGGDARLETAVDGPHTLADRLERLEPRRRLGGVQAQAFERVVVDQGEDRDRTLSWRPGRRCVGGPHHVGRLGDDRAIVRARSLGRARALRRQQRVLAHQPQHTGPTGPHIAFPTQPRPDLAMALTQNWGQIRIQKLGSDQNSVLKAAQPRTVAHRCTTALVYQFVQTVVRRQLR